MLRQELQQTKESLAARDAELRELKGRVADLERLQSDQQQLLTLKDTELAAAQQRLAASNRAAATPAAAVATPPAAAAAAAQTATTAQPAAPAQPSVLTWVLGGIGILALALLAAWLLRRRTPSRSRFVAPAPMSAASLADAFAPVAAQQATAADAAETRSSEDTAAVADLAASPAAVAEPSPPARAEPATAEPATTGPALWDRRDRQQLPSGRPERAAASAPAWHGGGKSRTAEAVVDDVVATPVGERLELAQAYLDLGDRDSARQLLAEVAAGGDPASRQQASRMLRELE